MKRIFRLSFLALFLIAASCDDARDIIQESELNDEAAFRTIEDIESGVRGVYGAYGPDFAGNGNGDAFLFNDLFTDNLRRGPSNLGQGSQEYNFSVQPGSQVPGSIWGNRYATINFANRMLRAIDRLYAGFSDADKASADRLKGEMLAMRALCHLDLISYFATDYENDGAAGVIIMNYVPEIDEDLPRSTVGDVFAFINQDLNAADDLLPVVNELSASKFFLNKYAAKAIHARAALFEGNYGLAETLSNELIDMDYALADEPQYADMWQAGNYENPEVIFALARLQGDPGVAANWYANRVNIEGSPFLQMSVQLYNEYDAGDIRKTYFVDDSSVIANPANATGSDIILVGKYQAEGAAGLLVQSVPIFRITEMYLIRAEAEARDGRLTEAAATLREVWLERYNANVPAQANFSNTTEALKAILDERRKEFAFEGHRYLDLKRMGTDAGVTTMSRDDADCASFSAPCDISLTDYRFTLPIPTSELSANPTIEQNPGYTN